MDKTVFSTALLRERIKEHGISFRDLAKQLDIGEWAMGQKLLGRYEFKASEIDRLCEILNIMDEDIRKFFFTKKYGKS